MENVAYHSYNGVSREQKIMFGAVPASLILSLAKSDGVMSQLQLDLGCPPWVFVDPELLTSCVAGFSVVGGDGESTGVSSSEDHPRFRDTRQWLANKGYIDMVTTWHNGDTVLKPFYFNNVFKQVGDSFMCAAAMQRSHTELYNHGEPLPVPNIVIKQPSQPVWDDSYTVTEVGFPDHFDAVKDEQDDLI